jgi:5-(hydroxymethyl)furfural/furfural oxidase
MNGKIDYLILGGGSAGCVLASRLSEDPDVSVVLVEAGRDLTKDSMPSDIRSRYPGKAFLNPDYVWPSLECFIGAEQQSNNKRVPRLYEQARVLGGGSAINAMVANRGSPGDYDEWGKVGADGWNGETALKYFRKLEHDVDFDDDYHGKGGPIPVRRVPETKVSPFVKHVKKTLVSQGYALKADQNGPWEDGIFPAAIAVSDDGERVPASIAYLTPEVRKRPNLSVRTEAIAETLEFDGGRVSGVQILSKGKAETLHAEETIVALGGIHSCALLMRSGIGSSSELKDLGIDVHADLPGVGKNLMEHPLIAVSTYLPAGMRMQDPDEHHDQALLRWTSSIPDAPDGDMHFAIIGRTAAHKIGLRMGTILIWVNKSFSRGEVRLKSADVHTPPHVDFQLLSDRRDLDRLKEGARKAASILTDPKLTEVTGPAFPTSYSERVKKVSQPGVWNGLQLGLLAATLDLAGPLRERVIHSVITLGVSLKTLLDDDDALGRFVAGSVSGVWHASGTCRMGSSDDRLAVTNGEGLVYGVPGLRVCDASIMPTIPRANTNMPTLMLAECIADRIKHGRRQ